MPLGQRYQLVPQGKDSTESFAGTEAPDSLSVGMDQKAFSGLAAKHIGRHYGSDNGPIVVLIISISNNGQYGC